MISFVIGIWSVWVMVRMLASQSLTEDFEKGYKKLGLIGCVMATPLLVVGVVMAFVAQVWEDVRGLIVEE